jgi:taurine dioxygenase
MNQAFTQSVIIGCAINELNSLHLSPDQISEVIRCVYHNKFVVIKNQQLIEQQFCDFSVHLGEPVPYLQDNYHQPEYPLTFAFSDIKQNGKEIGVAGTGGYWHADTAFLDNSILLTLLYTQVAPGNSKRTTLFIDL